MFFAHAIFFDRKNIYFLARIFDKQNLSVRHLRNTGETEQIFFGATVAYVNDAGEEHTISIVGVDEADPARGRVSWISPIAKALLRKQPGDVLQLATPGGLERIEVVEVRYTALD